MNEINVAQASSARHIMTRDDAVRAAAQLRPSWSDHCLTETVLEPGEAAAVRFAVRNDGYSLYVDSSGKLHALRLSANTMPFWET